MKASHTLYYLISGLIVLVLMQCTEKREAADATDQVAAKSDFGGFDTQEKWGEHLVMIAGCHDCHTPKKMGPNGPELDMSLMLSGHPAQMPAPPINRKDAETKGLIVTQTLTAWVGPWGVSYAANLTPDSTGTGNWQESNFITAIREGKYKGIASGRSLLPPMPWEVYRNMTDAELKAIFAFLRTVKPVKNMVPQPNQPVLAQK